MRGPKLPLLEPYMRVALTPAALERGEPPHVSSSRAKAAPCIRGCTRRI